MSRLYRLRSRRVHVDAPRSVTFDIVAAAGRVTERRSERERVVEFTAEAGGTRYKTSELVTLDRPETITYLWLDGPLPHVEETIDFVEHADRSCEMRYRGRFATSRRGITGWIESRKVRELFDSAVVEHLEQARDLAVERTDRLAEIARKKRDRSATRDLSA